jgi:glycosyltransferase involved in cell wall biosynthesis
VGGRADAPGGMGVKVIYSIGAKFAGGGIGTTAYHAVRGLHRHGLLYRLLCGSFRPTEIPGEKIRAMGLPSRALRKLATFDASGWVWYLQSLLFDAWASRQLEQADLFHAWGNYGLSSLRRAKEMGMVTVVKRASSHPLYQARLLKEEYARWGIAFRTPQATLRRGVIEMEEADYVLIPSDFVRRSFVEEGFPERRLLQAAFGADTTRFRPAEERGSHPLRVLFVGQIGIRKGVPYLLEAWRQLEWRDAELWLVGRAEADFGPLLARWDGLPGVKLVGHVPDPVAMYQQADLFAFPSIEEGSALVTYEALACGLPVVTTPNAGSVVRDGLEGFIAPIRDVDALAAALERLRASEQLRQEMGRAARERAEEFTWERFGQQIALAFQEVAGCGRAGEDG